MKSSPVVRWMLPVLRYGLCVVAVIYLASVVKLDDRVQLVDTGETWHKVVENRPDGLVVDIAGTRETISHERVRRVVVGGREVEQIERGLKSVIRSTDHTMALLSVAIFLPVILIQSARLVVMLAVQGVRLGLWPATKLTFAGNFFNFALPGTTGGDVFKAYYITKYTHLKTEAVTTVFLDRAIGLFGLVVLAGSAILFTRDPSQFGQIATSLLILCGVLAVGAIVVFSQRVREALRLPDLARRLPMGEQLLRVGKATVAMRDRKRLVLLALAMTLVLQAIVMVSAAVMAWALGLNGSLSDFFIYCSIGFLIAAIPISPPQAIGVMEAAYVQFFTQAGLGNDPSQAVALALAVRLIQLFWAIPGVLVPLLGAHLPSQRELDSLADDGANPPGSPGEALARPSAATPQ